MQVHKDEHQKTISVLYNDHQQCHIKSIALIKVVAIKSKFYIARINEKLGVTYQCGVQ